MATVELNVNRLNHLLRLFSLSTEDFLTKISAGRKNRLSHNEVFSSEIKVSVLKKIDAVFQKGLSYYIDPRDVQESREESIFFRKDSFNAQLSLGAKQIVNKFEEEKISFSTLAKLSDFKLKRQLPVYTVSQSAKSVALEVRNSLYPYFVKDKRSFLKSLISKFADFNIVVFEFVETHNKTEKANINGFYLSPNVIVLKRNQKSLKREIFTLVHELGHYLLNEEEIDENIHSEIFQNDLNTVEKWCNDFAYFFLAGKYDNEISNFLNVNSANDYYTDQINWISENTHLSTLAIYTRLRINNQISQNNYNIISDNIIESIKAWEAKEKAKQELEKQKALEEGRKLIIPAPKPIISPLYLKTLQTALSTGLISEAEFCKKLSLKPENIHSLL